MTDPIDDGRAERGSTRRVSSRRWVRWTVRGAVALGIVLLVVAVAGGLWVRSQLRASLPRTEGTVRVDGLGAPVEVGRDRLGVPTIRGRSRMDLAYATGFVHAQERFFQMDFLRRRASGELAELFGSALFEADRRIRRHRFEAVAGKALRASRSRVRNLVDAYARGVNAGLDALDKPSFEYLVLRTEPEPWEPKDSFLILLALFKWQQDRTMEYEKAMGVLHEHAPPSLYAFLSPWGTSWDAPLKGGPMEGPMVPGPEVLDLREQNGAGAQDEVVDVGSEPQFVPGSNGWIVSGEHTADGRPLLANDMHMSLLVPTLWFRIALEWSAADGTRPNRRLTGLTLPGTPLVVAGSNGHIAWGFTNALADTSDHVVVEFDPGDPNRYRTPEGYRELERHTEVLKARDGEEESFEIAWTIWGPVVEEGDCGRTLALRWVAHDEQAVNLELFGLETTDSVEGAMAVAHRSGLPAQSFLVADAQGHIGWTIAGRLPRREGLSGRYPRSWADGERGWEGWLAPESVPRILDPESGRIWAANNRLVEGEELKALGDGGYVVAARAHRIRERLSAMEEMTPEDMLELQLDTRGFYYNRWRDLLLGLLSPEALDGEELRAEAKGLVADWKGFASTDSAGYRIIRQFRVQVAKELFAALTRECCVSVHPEWEYYRSFLQSEGPLWKIVVGRPDHLIPPPHESWRDFFLTSLDETLAELVEEGGPLRSQTWGERNTLDVGHPLSGALPLVGGWLKLPAEPMPGDLRMPRVHTPDAGASMRMVLSPGWEGEGIFHMPGGQSGHPLSPYYRQGHDAWVEGRATPFQPAEPRTTMELIPAHECRSASCNSAR